MLGAATVLAFLSGHAFPGEFAALFRVQYALGLAVVAAAAVATRRWSVASAAVLLLVLDLGAIAPALAAPGRPDPQGSSLRLLVANVWYAGGHYDRVARLIQTEHPDVVGLVELTRRWDRGLADALRPYRYRVVRAQPGAFGVGLYSRVELTNARIVGFGSPWPAAATGAVRVNGHTIRLFVVHPPPPIRRGSSQRQRDFMGLLGDAAARTDGTALVCGDFNATPWSGPFRNLLARGGLRRADRWRPLQWTWPVDRLVLRIPIDHCVAGDRVAVRVRRGPDIGSDHLPQLVEAAPAR